jgi:hypothetical protein
MGDIIHFTPESTQDADANLRNFVDSCRTQLTAFGASLKFADNTWDVTDSLQQKRTRSVRIVFSTWDSTKTRETPFVPFPEPFLSFAKAYLRYQHGLRPTRSIEHRTVALRALQAALSENGSLPNPTLINPQVLNRATQLCAERFTRATAAKIGGALEMICRFMADNRLMIVPALWKNPTTWVGNASRIGREFDRQRYDKLPSPAALSALANIFRSATEPSDVLLSSVAAILCSSPNRISEVLYLNVDCEVAQTIPSTGQAAYGLRWRPAKGAKPMIKWIIPAMTDVVKEALSNIRRLTRAARDVAKWYESNPSKLYLPLHLEHLRSYEKLTTAELAAVLFVDPVDLSTVENWARRNKVRPAGTIKRKGRWRFADVQSVVLARLPRGFPIANAELGLRYSEALCLIQEHLFSTKRTPYRCVIRMLSMENISQRLSNPADGRSTIFERLGFTEPDGSPIKIRTHQFRHYLNTLAQIGGLSQLDIAKWSGRKDVRQNSVYDHQSDRDVLALVRSVVGGNGRMLGPLARADRTALIPRDEFARLKVPTAHTTDFGYCIHDFTMLPCQIHRDCMNCDEQVCIKGDAVREANIRQRREETRALLEEATAATAKGYAGANRWVEHQERTLTRFDKLCLILDDPNVPLGSVIQPSGIVPASRLEQAARQRGLRGSAATLIDFSAAAPRPVSTDGAVKA